MLNNQTQAFGLSIFVAELHKVVAASRLPNIAVLRLSYHHRTKEMQRLFFPCFYLQRKKWKNMGTKHLQKYFFEHNTDGEVHMLTS